MSEIRPVSDNFWRSLTRLAIPIALQNLLISSLTFVDTLFMSQLGDIPLSAAGMAGQWSWLMTIVLFGINSGAAIFISQYWGVRNTKQIRRIYGVALTGAAIISAFFFSMAFFAPGPVLSCFNRDPAVLDCGISYIKIACFSYPAIALNNVMCAVLRSTEKVRLPMIASGVTTAVNIILDYALMFGHLGMPEMGVEGAALATAIAAWSGLAVNLTVSLLQKNILIARLRHIFDFDKRLISDFAKKAMPTMANELMWGLGTVVANIIYANTGYENYAAVTILRTVESLAAIFFIGISDGGGVIVGNLIGAGRIKDSIKAARRLAVLVPSLSVAVGAAVIAFRSVIINVFNLSGNVTAFTLELTAIIMVIYACELPLRNIPYIMVCGIYRPGGDATTGTKYDILCLWGLAVPATLIAAFVLKLPFPLIFLTAYIFEDALKVFLCIRHFISLKWIRPVTQEGRENLRIMLEEKKAEGLSDKA